MKTPRNEYPVLEIFDLRELDFRKLAFMALRSLIRAELGMQILYGRELPGKHQKMYEEQKAKVVEVINAPSSISRASEILKRGDRQPYEIALNDLEPGSPERFCFACALDSFKIRPNQISYVLHGARSLGANLIPGHVHERFRLDLAWAEYDDYKLVKDLSVADNFLGNPYVKDPELDIWWDYEPEWDFYKQHIDPEIG